MAGWRKLSGRVGNFGWRAARVLYMMCPCIFIHDAPGPAGTRPLQIALLTRLISLLVFGLVSFRASGGSAPAHFSKPPVGPINRAHPPDRGTAEVPAALSLCTLVHTFYLATRAPHPPLLQQIFASFLVSCSKSWVRCSANIRHQTRAASDEQDSMEDA